MIEDKLLNSAINSQNSWDDKLIEELCSIHSLTQDTFEIVFPKGIESLADRFFERVDEEMIKIVSDEFHKLPINVQVVKLLEARLNYMSINKVLVIKILSMKSGLTYQISHLLKVSDLMWQNINHKSSGFDYYTRRMILANIYKNCLIYFKRNVSTHEMIAYAQGQFKTVGRIIKFKKKFCK